MPRVRSSMAAAVLVAGLAGSARADGPPLPNPSLPGAAPPAAAAPSPEAPAPRKSAIRGFFHKITHGSKTPRSGHADWSTGNDSRLSKPWLQPPSGR